MSPHYSSAARAARIAALAALVASAGDLLMLYVANAQRPELGLPPPGRGWLVVGGVLGIVAIPFYVAGYWSASRPVAVVSDRGARIILLAGGAGSIVGAFIHGLTAAEIAREIAAGAPIGDPLASIAASGPLLPSLWGVATLSVLAASVGFAWFVGRGVTAAPRWAALLNPALLTIVLALAPARSDLWSSFLTPAAPNLAHVVFFMVCSSATFTAAQRPPD